MMKHKNFLIVVFLFLILPLIAFWRNFDFSGLNLSFFHAEFAGFYFPEFIYGTQLMHQLRQLKGLKDALWDPYNMLGLPLVGGIDRIGMFYPIRTVFYFIASFFPQSSYIYFATFYSLFHMSLAGIFTYLFAKRCLRLSAFASFVAAIVYAFGGTFIYLIVYINHVTGPAFLPLTLYLLVTAIERNSYRRAILAGFSLAPILLAGYFPMFFYNNMFVAMFVLFYFTRDVKTFANSLKFLLIANIIAILLSSIMLFPNIELSRLAERQTYNLGGSASNPTNPDDLVHYFIPHLYGVDKAGLVYGYVGMMGLLLIFLALRYAKNRVVTYSIISIFIFLVLSLGNMTFAHALLYKFLPLWGSFRRPGVLHYIIGLNLAFLVGYGLFLLENKKIELTVLYKTVGLFVTGFALIWFGLFFLKPLMPVVATVNEMIYSTALVLIFAAGSAMVVRYLYTEHQYVFRIAVVIIILLDLFTLNARTTGNNSDYDPRIINSKSEIVRTFEPGLKEQHHRAYFHESTLRYHSGPEKIYQIDGYYGLNTKQYGLLMTHYSKDGWIHPASPLHDILAVRYIFTTRGLAPEEKYNVAIAAEMPLAKEDFGRFLTTNGTKVAIGTPVFAYENLDVLPHAYLVGKRVQVKTDEEAVTTLDTINLHESAVITSILEDLPALGDVQGSTADIAEYKSSYVKVNVNNVDGRTLLVLSDSYYPGWKAYIDGSKTDIYRTNVALRGVFVEEGLHTVEFKYQPTSFYMGATVSITTLLFSILYLIIQYKKAKLHV